MSFQTAYWLRLGHANEYHILLIWKWVVRTSAIVPFHPHACLSHSSHTIFFFQKIWRRLQYNRGNIDEWSIFKWLMFSFSRVYIIIIYSISIYIYIYNYNNGEKAMALHSITPAWKIPWMEEPGGLQSMGSLRVGPDWATSLSLFTFMHWRRKWQPAPMFLRGESQGRESLVGCHLWGRAESDTTEATWQQQQQQHIE